MKNKKMDPKEKVMLKYNPEIGKKEFRNNVFSKNRKPPLITIYDLYHTNFHYVLSCVLELVAPRKY